MFPAMKEFKRFQIGFNGIRSVVTHISPGMDSLFLRPRHRLNKHLYLISRLRVQVGMNLTNNISHTFSASHEPYPPTLGDHPVLATAPACSSYPTPPFTPQGGSSNGRLCTDITDAVSGERKPLQTAVFLQPLSQGLAVPGRQHRDGRPFFYGQGTGTDPGEIYRWGSSQTNVTWMEITRP